MKKEIKVRIKDIWNHWHYYSLWEDFFEPWQPDLLRAENYRQETLELVEPQKIRPHKKIKQKR